MTAVHLISITVSGKDLAQAAVLSAVMDTSASGSAIFSQALDLAHNFSIPKGSHLIAPSGDDDFSGVDMKTRKIRKGSYDHIQGWLREFDRKMNESTLQIVSDIESRGHQAIVLADQEHELGVIELSEVTN
jgi:high-affinity K+ transport system ATPase subunit B